MQQLEIGEEKTIAREEGSQVGGCQDDLETLHLLMFMFSSVALNIIYIKCFFSGSY